MDNNELKKIDIGKVTSSYIRTIRSKIRAKVQNLTSSEHSKSTQSDSTPVKEMPFVKAFYDNVKKIDKNGKGYRYVSNRKANHPDYYECLVQFEKISLTKGSELSRVMLSYDIKTDTCYKFKKKQPDNKVLEQIKTFFSHIVSDLERNKASVFIIPEKEGG